MTSSEAARRVWEVELVEVLHGPFSLPHPRLINYFLPKGSLAFLFWTPRKIK